jgi:tetratricopeptide (TPR) repeat protein
MSPPKSFVRFTPWLAVAFILCQAALEAEEVDRRQLFVKTVRGCCGVMTAGGPASGWVADVQKRWIVTCQHVVGSREEVEIVFPTFKDGRLIQERNYYLNTASRLKGKVLSNDAKRDLCLIQLEALPPGTEAAPLASDSGQPGDNLSLIGNPAASGAMWNFTTGTLRAVYKKRFMYKNTSHEVDAVVGETQLAANPGDSGGAVFNDRGEVLGVHSGGTPDGIQLMATYIDVLEVRAFLREPFKVVAKIPNFDDFYSAGNELLQKNEVDKAIEAYTQAVNLKPDYSEAWRCRASAFIRKKLYDKALEDCERALMSNRANARAYNERAVCYGAKGDLKAALGDYNDAIRLNPLDAMFWAGRAWTNNGLQEHGKAVEDANEALRIKSDFALAYAERGLAHFRLKDYDKALADLNQALKLQPANSEALYCRGLTLAIQKKIPEALEDFTEAIRINPKYAAAYKERSLCYKSLGNDQQATADYNEAVRLNPALGRPADIQGRQPDSPR